MRAFFFPDVESLQDNVSEALTRLSATTETLRNVVLENERLKQENGHLKNRLGNMTRTA